LVRAYRQTALSTAPSMTTPAVTYFQSATSSFRASATIVVFLRRPPLRLTRSSNHRVSAERGWWRTHSHASWDQCCAQSWIGRPWRPLARDRQIHSARVLAPGPRTPRPVVDYRSVGRAPPPKDAGELGPDALDVEQHHRRRDGVFRDEQRIPLGLHSLYLLDQQFDPVELAATWAFR